MEISLLREYLADIQSELMSLVNEKKNDSDNEIEVHLPCSLCFSD